MTHELQIPIGESKIIVPDLGLESQQTLELTTRQITLSHDSDRTSQSKSWQVHQTAAAATLLKQEAEKIRDDLRLKSEHLKSVEAQIRKLERGEEDSDDIKNNRAVKWCRSHLLWIVSAVMSGVLKIIFCVVFGSLIHESAEELLHDSTPIGVGAQLVSAFITCLITPFYTTVGATIAGPDIIQALMMGNMAKVIQNHTDDKEVALATILFLTAVSTMSIALTWLLIVRYRLMKVLDFFPISVVTGFLGCIGYKVVEEAIHISVGDYWYSPGPGGLDFWKLFLPIIPLGLPLFLLKRFHVGSPIVVFPFFVIVPLVVFFGIITAEGLTIEDMRKQGWVFEEMDKGNFLEQWTKLNFRIIEWGAVLACIPDVLILTLVMTLDCFLKLSSTKTELKAINMDIEKELKIAGWQNVLCALCVGTAGYSQIKFNVLNFAITNDNTERRPCLFVGLLCGLVWLVGFPLTNSLPRFFISGLLLYAGLPFVDMVITAYWRFTKKEFFSIVAIVLVNAIMEVYVTWALLIAVIVGLVLAAIIFMVQYSRVSVIRDVISGKDFSSKVVRSYAEQRLVERLGVRYTILELQGFLFFGTARQVLDWCKAKERENNSLASCKQLRFIAIDFTHVENMDWSCANTFTDIVDHINVMGCQLLIVGMNEKITMKLGEGVLKRAGVLPFQDLDYASEYVEDCLLERASHIRLHWLMYDSFRKLHTKALLMATYEIFEAVLGCEIGGRIWRYAEQREFKENEYLCREGQINRTLFLLQHGKVTSTKKSEGKIRRLHTMRRGAFFNEECLFLDQPVSYSSYANEDCVVWTINRNRMKELEAHDPFLAAAILRNILRVMSAERTRLEREVNAFETSTLEPKSKPKGLGHNILVKSAELTSENFENAVDENVFDTEHVLMKSFGDTKNPRMSRRGRHFGHISVDLTLSGINTPARHDSGKLRPQRHSTIDLLSVNCHLSQPMRNEVIDCFMLHSACSGKKHNKIPKGNLGKWGFFSSRDNLSSNEFLPDCSEWNSTSNMSPKCGSISIFEKAADRRIKLQELQKAVMDLGFFPTTDEIQLMHESLGQNMERITGEQHEHGADIREFIRMIEILSFAELTSEQRRQLLTVFRKYSDKDNRLWRDGLAKLMQELGHAEDELELEMLMREWDVRQHGYIGYSDFISIVAQVMKTEELDAKVEHDFLLLCGTHKAEIEGNRENLLMSSNSGITAEDLIRVSRQRHLDINPEIAEEMIFDACDNDSGKVSLNELITTIETVYRKETIPRPGKKPEYKSRRELIPGFMGLQTRSKKKVKNLRI